MKINCLASGSKGNCYIIEMGSGCFILDAGIPIQKITKSKNLNDVDFAFISHEHNDHATSLKDLALRGVEIIKGNLIHEFKKNALNRLKHSKFQVFCFPVKHGDAKNSGIIVYLEETKECLLYVTDFTVCEYDLDAWLDSYIPEARFTHIMVECNYLEELIMQQTNKEKRQINTHMGLKGLQLFLDKLNLSNCKEIVLMHMSQTYGDPIIMASTIYSKYKIKTGICKQWGGIDYYG